MYSISSRGEPTRGGPTAWVLGVELTTPHRKTFFIVTKHFKPPRTWTHSLARNKIEKGFDTWKVRSLCNQASSEGFREV
jgi:hypothetical protein